MGPVNAYATALFSEARERGKIEEIGQELKGLCHLFDTIKNLDIFLNHPIITAETKKNVIKSALSQKISQEMQNFIFFLIDKNRQDSLKEILGAYSNLYREYKNQRYAKVFTVVELHEDEKEALKIILDTKFNTDSVIENIIDETIIGGMIIRIGFEVIDGSLISELNKIKSSILQGEFV